MGYAHADSERLLREMVMKNLMVFVSAAIATLGLATGCSHKPATAATPGGVDTQQAQLNERVGEAGRDLEQLITAPDNAIPQTVLAKAKCVSVVPDMVKGGFVVGGQHGRGLVTCRTANGWSAPAPITISGGSWGAQIGVEQADIVLLFMNDGAVQSLLNNKLKIGGEAAIAAGPIGRDAQASTDAALNAQILSYSRVKGLFAGLDLSGAAVRQDMDSTVALYGKSVPFRDILTGAVPPPPSTMAFLNSVSKSFQEARTDHE